MNGFPVRLLLVGSPQAGADATPSGSAGSGLEIIQASNAEEALAFVSGETFDLVLWLLSEPGMEAFRDALGPRAMPMVCLAGGVNPGFEGGLQAQLQRWFLHIQQTPLAVIEWDLEGRVRSWNPAAETLFGFPAEEAIGQPIIELIVPPRADALDQVRPIAEGLFQQGRTSRVEHENRRKDGSSIFCRWFNTPLTDEAGQALGVASMALDVTEIQSSNQALRESERRFRVVADFTHDWEYWISDDGTIPWMSPSCGRITGYPVEAFQGDPALIYRICHPDDLALLRDHVHEVLGQPGFSPIEFRIQHRDGHELWFSHLCTPVWDSLGHPTGRRVTNRDITERKKADTALLDSEARLRRAETVARIGNWELDLALGEIQGSAGAQAIYGLSGDKWTLAAVKAIVLPEYRTLLDEALANLIGHGRPYHEEFKIRRPSDGKVVDIHSVAEFDPERRIVFGVINDITNRKRAEREKAELQVRLQQAQKMESLGTLAGGIAHDMNNVLGAILGLASVNLETQPPGTPSYRSFETIAKAATRGGDLVKGLLRFAHQGPTERQDLDLNTVLVEQVHLLERTTLSKIRLELDLEPNLRHICGDPSALTHAFMNLCVNSVHAMPEQGTLTLRTQNLDPEWVEVLVQDTGTGMSKEVLDRALEPFFTTKGIGKGTGLGLSMVYSTMEAHQGKMEIQSEPGRGTTISLRFPVCNQAFPAPEPSAGPRPEEQQQALNVLLVDDDELMQSAVESLLRALGHVVVTASSGEVALTTVEAGFIPDVVILDMNMPGLSGAGTLPRLRRMLPNVPVLLSTGRVDQAAKALVEAHPQVALLPKPFTMTDLEQKLQGLLQES
jgi:PAS domain S-box-containing protein